MLAGTDFLLCASYQDAGGEDDGPAQYHLEGGLEKAGVHVARPDSGDDPQLDGHNSEGHGGRNFKVLD